MWLLHVLGQLLRKRKIKLGKCRFRKFEIQDAKRIIIEVSPVYNLTGHLAVVAGRMRRGLKGAECGARAGCEKTRKSRLYGDSTLY